MSTPEQVFTARQAAQRLGLSLAMTRRYGAVLEEMTGEPIRQHPRDGRQYRRDQLEAMLRARDLIRADPQLSVKTALERALGNGQGDAIPPVAALTGSTSPTFPDALARELLSTLEALRAELAEARTDREELREELRQRDAEALRAGRTWETPKLPEAPTPAAGEQTAHVTAAATGPGGGGGADEDGPLAQALHRIGRRLERLFLRR